ncbi:PP2C family protein-serine/threonine phosphatase [Candidatus Neptunichlamydia sp. REUL1]|uniref:PP2C family protein-serine/threonine phosphatase n=1 Tax=Candidatus Neptunichlamydia sp. REUL1 TaxID=3064277 RepID=UPI00292DE255|nr:PP2C family protein-serine/threonine phosphatase [Candidatus Neptunochlamydia sp. REUL1]
MNREKKEKLRGMGGSLAARIFLIATLFLIIPLLTLVGLLYIDDLRVKKDNNNFTLKVIMDQKVGLIEGIISREMEVLSEVSYLLRKIPNPEGELDELARRDGVVALFHVKKMENGQYTSDMASKEAIKGKDFTGLIDEAKKGIVFVVEPSVPIFYLTRYVPERDEAWITVFHLAHLSKNFPIEKNSISSASTSLIDREGMVIASTDENLKGHQFVCPVEGKYSLNDETFISKEKHVPKTNFFLLISAPEQVNFVDIPYFFMKILIILGLIILVGGGGAILLTKKLGKPLRKLIQIMDHVARGDLKKRYTSVSMGFEINGLGEIFNETVSSLDEHIEVAHKERLEKETYEQELLIGEEVQAAILPKELPKFPGVDMAARFIAAKEVGGDFYDFLTNGQLMLSIADTSGKGISACLYSLSVRSMLRSYGEIHEDLDVIVRETNNLFCLDTGDTGVFVTAFIAFFDPKTKLLHYSNCGHFPALLQRADGSIEMLSTKGMALGVVPFEAVSTDKVQVKSGDTLMLYTDGVVEAHNDGMEMFGEERLLTSFRDKKDLPPKQIVDDMIEEVALFAEGSPQHDDLTIVILKIL